METLGIEERVWFRDKLDYFVEVFPGHLTCQQYIKRAFELIDEIKAERSIYWRGVKIKLLGDLIQILSKREGLKKSGLNY